MMAEKISDTEAFQEMLTHLYERMPQEPLLQKFRSKAWDHFLELGLPSRKSEPFRYLRLRNLYGRTLSSPVNTLSASLDSTIYPECRGSVLVFVNGSFQPSLSQLQNIPKNVIATSLPHAMSTFGAFIQNQWNRSLKEESDPFVALNAAMHTEAAFLYIPPKTIFKSALQIIHVTEGERAVCSMPRLHCFVGSQSHLDLYSTQICLSDGHLINQVLDLVVEEDAHVRYVQNSLISQENVWHLEALRAHLKRNSRLDTVSITEGSATVRHDYQIFLRGENGEVSLKGIWMLGGKREAHTHVLIDHQAPNCRSRQLYKGALADFSRSSFEGKILVRQLAQKTEAFQSNHNLLLSDRAHADSKPNLEIFADDVKASHGATVGQLDKEQLFYLKSRGFLENQAKDLLVYGFCKEVLDAIPLPSLHTLLTHRAQNYLSRLHSK